MQLSNTRFIRIEGTEVRLLAADDREARLALKELRHKKRELLHWKRRLRRRAQTIKARNSRELRTGTSPELGPFAFIGRSLGAVMEAMSGWNPFPVRVLPTTLDGVAEDIRTLDEALLNVEAAMLHVTGKLALAE